MESEDVEPSGEVATTTSPQHSGVTGLTSTGSSSSSANLVSRSVSDVEGQRRPRLLPAASAVHLVPDIVVEHVPSSSFSDVGTSRQPLPLPCLGLSPTSSDVASTGRQFRALSDSSVQQLERHQHSPSADTRRRATCPEQSSRFPEQFSSAGVHKFGTGDLSEQAFSLQSSSQGTSGSASRQCVKQQSSLPVTCILPAGFPYWQPSLPSVQSLAPDRSPKANWLRRHSDSNLTSGHSSQAGLRLEPYPIRSRSTGDTLLNVVSPQEQPAPSTSKEPFHMAPKVLIPVCGHSKWQHATVPLHLWSTAGRSWQERASPTGRKFLSEGSRPSDTDREDWQMSEHSHSESASFREYLPQFEKTGFIHSEHIPGTDEPPARSSAVSTEQTDVIDMSMRECAATTERSEGLVEKRMKLKKYLQTRYQMSQHRLRQSSDTDDVFTERISATDYSLSSSSLVAEVSEPKDLSTKAQSVRVTKSVSDDDSERTSELNRGISRHFSVSPGSQEPIHSRIFYPPSAERSRFPRSADDVPLLMKREPTSPGIVPSGTSVFVFPPTLPSHHEPTEWYQPVRHRSASPVPSPLSSGIPEGSNPVVLYPRFFRQPSFPGDEAPYRATGLRMGHQHMPPSVADVSAIYHRRACSLALSTDISPLTLAESFTSTPQHHYTVAGPEMASCLSPPETFSYRLPHGSQWPRHIRGRRSSSSFEDPANFTCPVCGAVFPSYRHLTDHMVDHAGTRSSPPPPSLEPVEQGETEAGGSEVGGGTKSVHLCPVCKRTFSRGDMLTRHVRLHTGIRPYECNLCSQVFSRSDHLTTHQRTHTGEKPYQCSMCDYAAPRRDMVTRHTRIHESSSSAGHGGERRHRRAGSTSSERSSGGVYAARAAFSRSGTGRRAWRRRSDSSGFASARQWSPSTCDDLRSSTSSYRWSQASCSIESTDSAVVMGRSTLASAVAGRGLPVTCRGWSTTSAESFESYPGAGHHRSSLSSAPCDSPDVFAMHPHYFRWGVDPSSGSEAKMGSSTSVGVAVDESSVSADVAGVMPALQKCSVKSPVVSDRDQSTEPQ